MSSAVVSVRKSVPQILDLHLAEGEESNVEWLLQYEKESANTAQQGQQEACLSFGPEEVFKWFVENLK